MAVDDRRSVVGAPDRTPTEVPVTVRVSDEDSPGIRGFVGKWASLVTGLRITARRALGPASTVRYPTEKVVLSPRWRGALRLRGILGRDEIGIISSEPPAYNGVVDRLYNDSELPPCVGNCPANVDARGQNFFLADDDAVSAYELVRERNIMPGVLGRICHHPCESACTRNYYDEALAIRPLHRVAYERYQEHRAERLKPLPRTQDREVAIIGSGPSGLSAALDLMRLGYGVTVYEKDDKPGGALYTGVPSYRLPREVLHGEIDDLVSLGMRLHCNTRVGHDIPIDYLVGEFDAVLIAAGLQQSRMLPISGADAEGVTGALEFLRAGNLKRECGVRGKKVVVVGGGNVAVDCARVALRTGAEEVTLASLESMDELPAHPWEIEEALDEGVVANCSWGPHEVMVEDGRCVGMRLRSCLSVFDAQGRFSPEFAEEYTEIEADVVVFSIGQAAELADLIAGSDLMLTERGLLPVDGSLMTTHMPHVFACGEVVTGPGSCIASIASGHEAAVSIHRFLQGTSLSEGRVYRPVPLYEKQPAATLSGVEKSRRRVEMLLAKPEERCTDWRQVELGLTHLEGLAEAQRCLRCQSGVCVGCTFCARTCPDYAIQVDRIDDPGGRCVTRYDLDLSKCCYCGLCAEQCPTDALRHTGQYELSFYSRDLTIFDRDEMLRSPDGTRATGADAGERISCGVPEGERPQGSPRLVGREPGGWRIVTQVIVFWLLAALAVVGSLGAVLARDILRTTAGLGAFLLALAGFFALYGLGLLALAEIFLYVGGVLVLMLFAIMLVQRTERGRPDLDVRLSVPAVVAPLALVLSLIVVFSPAAPLVNVPAAVSPPMMVASVLLSEYLPQFEIAGLLLLAALVAVVSVMGGDEA